MGWLLVGGPARLQLAIVAGVVAACRI